MKGLRHPAQPDDDVEERLRAMLARRARDIDPQPPAWDDLLQRSGAVVVPLPTARRGEGDLAPASRGGSRNWGWVRPVAAAAACLALVMAAGIAIGRSTDGSGSPSGPASGQGHGGQTAADDGSLVPAGSGAFRPATAAQLYPQASEAELRAQADGQATRPIVAGVDLSDPLSVARSYLRAVGVDDPDSSPYALWADEPLDGRRLEQAGDRDGLVSTTTVWWSLRDAERATDPQDPPIVTMGYIYLRDVSSAAQARTSAWVVVGAVTQGLDIAEVRRDGDRLRFAVTPYMGISADVDTTGLPVQVEVNGEVINDEPLDAYQPTELTAEVPAGDEVTIRARQLGGGNVPLSIAETRFVPEAATSDTTPPSTTPPVVPGPGGGIGVAALGRDCAPEVGLSLSLALPPGFSTQALDGDRTGTVTDGLSCAVSFADATDASVAITVAWGQPAFPVAALEGPACFPWASLDDGGFVAVRTEPFPIYMVGVGLQQADFEQAVTTSVLTGSQRWAADQGC